jgi:cobyrinic acid a,c-diamide synthase
MQGVVIAGTHSGCGKTTITLGILAALKKRGYNVQPFKAGPDFIDTGLHKLVTGRTSRNLDLWMCGSQYVQECFQRHASDADIAVIEGVMGMYDGNHCTADLAVALDLPVVLVVDAYAMAESAGAIVKGFVDYGTCRGKARRAPAFAGVLFNRVASERHYKRLKDSIHDIPILGYLPRNREFNIPHRHLGLVVAEEKPIDKNENDKLADAILEHVDIEKMLQSTEHRIQNTDRNNDKEGPGSGLFTPGSEIKIAVAYDKAFCFYYEDNLELLKKAGAEIVHFSPLSDTEIPAGTDALYIGGGYPELHARKLSENRNMLDMIRDFSESGRPVYAECGGFMYLTEGIYDFDNVLYPMAGIFPFKTRMLKGRSRLGYREAVLKRDSVIGQYGAAVRGHEFHYSEIVSNTENANNTCRGEVLSPLSTKIYFVKDGSGSKLDSEGYMINNTLGSYIHIHFGSNPAIAGNFIKFSKEHYGTNTAGRTW